MKKISLFLSLLLAFALTAKAQVLVENAAEELTDGTVIMLESRATNGGGQYFNGESPKVTTFTSYVLYVVDGNAKTGMKLRRLADGKYVGGTGENNTAVVMTGDAEKAVTFTAASVGHGGKYDDDGAIMGGTDNNLLVRFIVKNNIALNAQGKDAKPIYYNGTGSFSVWYVYTYRNYHDNIVRNAEAELLNGTVIALQCRDYNGGAGYYFNGEGKKTPTFSANNLFVVEGCAATGMKLRRFNGTKKYIGKKNGVTEVESADEAATFTAKSYKGGNGFSTFDPGTQMDGTEKNLYVRFSVAEVNANGQTTTTHLNTANKDGDLTFAPGTGGYSAWYVYKFPEYSATFCETSLSFNRTSATTSDIIVSISGSGEGENGNGHTATATFTKEDNNELITNNILPTVLCPNTNIGNGTDPNAKWKFTLTGLPDDFSFSHVLLDIHPLTQNGSYQSSTQNRLCTVKLSCGEGEDAWSIFENINISKEVDNRSEWWTLTGEPVEVKDGNLVLTLDITRGSSHDGNTGFFVGLSGIKLIGNKISDGSNDFSDNTATKMNTADVADLLAGIKSGYNSLGYEFPVEVEGADVTWPQNLNNAFSNDLESNFKLLDYAQSAIENGGNLDAAKTNLAEFVRLSNKNYPISVIYTAAARYGTLYMPFAATLDGLTLRECTGRDENNDNVLTLTEGGSNAASNTAYIVEAEGGVIGKKTVQSIGYPVGLNQKQANSNTSLLVGTHREMSAPQNSYVLQNQKGVLGFYLVDGSTQITVPAGKCYLQLPNEIQDVKYLRFPDGTLTSIDAIDDAEPANAATYDLSGRRVGTMTKGLYIVDGRKVLVK